VALAATPALNANHSITCFENVELDGIQNTPLETLVNILLPWDFPKVWLLLREDEWVDTAIKMRVLDIVSN
jgi:hypothetical protein